MTLSRMESPWLLLWGFWWRFFGGGMMVNNNNKNKEGMMRVIAKERQSGKTFELIKRSAETGFPIVCRNERIAQSIRCFAIEHKLEIPNPYAYADFNSPKGLKDRNQPILIDDADALLEYLCRNPIDTITITTDS